mmetsp:Transcript_17574/g.35458  ORF Transcript_17574/g.35458 Transcript_17574/m.35458 type:complete len:560 (-) Transcript_17574:248-1927(-)|eukprot:CAMPEP_0167791658 /NCGR_PEP_ID=MMETSP0111_2-20121227/12069_1 /TAXON_ID=91324 /ORGANISM="Lotharella globosa, Strain CCCM811" /LENGTH=559 /DNA_ID=CAMNT_0007684373 /DNA_START=93 /DNA_END=1772 /DNA_ORIENTATION=-
MMKARLLFCLAAALTVHATFRQKPDVMTAQDIGAREALLRERMQKNREAHRVHPELLRLTSDQVSFPSATDLALALTANSNGLVVSNAALSGSVGLVSFSPVNAIGLELAKSQLIQPGMTPVAVAVASCNLTLIDGDTSMANDTSGELRTLGDPDLDAIVAPFPTDEASVLTFDVTPSISGNLSCDYVFGSEEYPEFANDDFNDIFAIFVRESAPGTSFTNTALLPNADVPISVNSINADVNSEFYNEGGATELDGYTDLLMSRDFPVVAGKTYNIKIAIGDVLDRAFCSAAFLLGAGLAVCTPGDISPTCQAFRDPHIQTFSGNKFEYKGHGEHVLTQYGSNKVTACFFQHPSPLQLGSFQQSSSYTCGSTVWVLQRPLAKGDPIRSHFVNNDEDHALLEGHTGDFKQCKFADGQYSCVCFANDLPMKFTATSNRFHGVYFLDTELMQIGGQNKMNLGGFCQGPMAEEGNVFVSGGSLSEGCESKTVQFPAMTTPGHSPYAQPGNDTSVLDGLRDAYSHFHKCGPCSWRVDDGPINFLAAKHDVVDACVVEPEKDVCA